MSIIGEVCRILGWRPKDETQEMSMLRHYYTAAKDYEMRMTEQSVLMGDILDHEPMMVSETISNLAVRASLLLGYEPRGDVRYCFGCRKVTSHNKEPSQHRIVYECYYCGTQNFALPLGENDEEVSDK